MYLCALLYIAVSACLHGGLVWYSLVLSPALRSSQLKWSGFQKEQTANLSAPGFLKMQDYVSVTIHLVRFRLTDKSQDPGAGKVGHHPFRVYWSLRRYAHVPIQHVLFERWILEAGCQKPVQACSCGNVSVASSQTPMTFSLSYLETQSIQSA